MPLRKRLSLVAAAIVAVSIASAAVVCYIVVREQLRSQLDSELAAEASLVRKIGNAALHGDAFPSIPANEGGPTPYWQVVGPGGYVPESNNASLPVDAAAMGVAARHANNVFEDWSSGATHLRILDFQMYYGNGYGQEVPVAVQLGRPLAPVDHILSRLRLILAFVLLAGIALAAALGRLAAKRVLAPLAEVTATAQAIGETDDLTKRLKVHADDEVGQLATRFNEMLARLESSRAELDESVRAQRQLVADASHELRTPVTSLRMNVEVLLAGADPDPEERRRLLADVVEQSEELTTLVADLIDLARGDLPDDSMDDVRLDKVVEQSLARARRNAPSVLFTSSLAPVIVQGNPERLEHAVNNLLDNAARHSPVGGEVEVLVDSDGVRVRDHGDGISPEDLPHIFDRFYRGAGARGSQGSGLGLAIVRQVARQHGGTITAANAPDGGAVLTLTLPTVPASLVEEPEAPLQPPQPSVTSRR